MSNTFIMKPLLALLIAVPFLTPSTANAYEQTHYKCSAYRTTEYLEPGHRDHNGNWVGGKIREVRSKVPCQPGGAIRVSHGYSQQPYHQQHVINNYPQQYPQQQYQPRYQQQQYPQQQYPQQQQQPVIINNQQPARSGGNCDQLARVGLGAGGGGAAGYFIGGGKKSKNTIRNTTIGAVAGGIIGRIMPC
jgi:hypothetical protein